MDNAEARPERRREEPGPGRRPDQREARQVDLDDPRRRTLADDEIELEVLEGRVEDLLDRRPEAMDLVDEEDVPRLQVGEDRRQIPGALEHRPGGGAERRIHLLGQDVRQGRLPQPGRAEEQHVVERLPAFARRADEDLQVLDDPVLPDVLRQMPRPERLLDRCLRPLQLPGQNALGR